MSPNREKMHIRRRSPLDSTQSNTRFDGSQNSSKKTGTSRRYRHNWRTDMLAVPRGRQEELNLFRLSSQERERYMKRQQQEAAEREMSLKEEREARGDDPTKKMKMEQLSLFSPRYYISQKKLLLATNKDLKLTKAIEKQLEIARKSPYHEYERARMNLKKQPKRKSSMSSMRARQRKKGGKTMPVRKTTPTKKQTKQQLIAEAIEYCRKMAIPKKIPKPPKIKRGKRGEISLKRIIWLSTPKYTYDQEDINYREVKVAEKALKYRPTAKIKEMAQPKQVRFIEFNIPGVVEPSALTAKASKRINELALPRVKVANIISDYNEDAFKISPRALKYIPTPRILELAKPLERD